MALSHRDDTADERCDLLDASAVDAVVAKVRPDAVVHLAGGPGTDLDDTVARNVITTSNVLEAAAVMSPEPFCIVIGSAAENLDESGRPTFPVASAYGLAKITQVSVAKTLSRLHSLPLTIVRPYNLVDPDLPASTALGNIRRQLLAQTGTERRLVVGRTDVTRDYVPVHLVLEAIIRTLELGIAGLDIDVCSGVGVMLAEVIDALALRLGVEIAAAPDDRLTGLPAPAAVVGNPALMRSALGLELSQTPDLIARTLLG